MKLLRDPGLSITHLNVVFQAVCVSIPAYTAQAWERFLSAEQIGKANAFCKKSFSYGIVKSCVTSQEILNKCDDLLLKFIQSSSNYLNSIVPVSRLSMHNTRRQANTTYLLTLLPVTVLRSCFVVYDININSFPFNSYYV